MVTPWRNCVADFEPTAIQRCPRRCFRGGLIGRVAMAVRYLFGGNGGFCKCPIQGKLVGLMPMPFPVLLPSPCSCPCLCSAEPTAPAPSNRADPSWKYVTPVEEGSTNNTSCNFCGNITKGRITKRGD
ncbi:hypothetical protein PIB30_050751 [Stylosanthes scabra]|uniref:Uncharacterized protein n=1 Tax=Stylosanthes scabra TaxID=79078 RepID=A0ABU6TJQ0_9FABA|nr:hypothetical protein [Stylosanthes scabra]